MPFSTLRKLCCYYTEKGKIRPKNLVGRECSVVIIMSVFYPLETLGNGAEKRTAVGLYPTYGRYLPHFVG